MGYALVTGGGTDGRYTISLDIGQSYKTATVATATAKVAAITSNLATAIHNFDIWDARVTAQRVSTEIALDAYVSATREPDNKPAADAALFVWNERFKELERLRQILEPWRINVEALRFALTAAEADLARWQNLTVTETRQAWCVDYTENATGYVGTIEICGESDHILIVPGGEQPVLSQDGWLLSRNLMSPEQAFFNCALLPGWQKYRPTYRRGTITALSHGANTASVALAAARSSAQNLDVNQATSLANVPVEYMEVGSSVFEVGDNVVVEFTGQDWGSPKVIGFVTDPRPPGQWRVWYAGFDYLGDHTYIGLKNVTSSAFNTLYNLGFYDDALTVEYRVNRGGWTPTYRYNVISALTYLTAPAGSGELLFHADTGFVGGFNLLFVARDELVGPGQICEFRVMHGAEILVNVAFANANDVAPVQVALYGGSIIPGNPLSETTTRAEYTLFTISGD